MRLSDPMLTKNNSQDKRDRLIELLEGQWYNENISHTKFTIVNDNQGRWEAD